MRYQCATAAIAVMMWPGAALLAQEAQDVQETVRVSVDGNIVELTIEQAAEACDMDAETIRANQPALDAGAGDPDSAVEEGAPGDAAAGADAAADAGADLAAADAGAEGAADPGAEGAAAAEAEAAVNDEGQSEQAADASAEEMAAGDSAPQDDSPEAAAGDSAPQDDSPEAAAIDNAALEAAADPEVPLPTADAVCEIDRVRAEELGLPAPD